jgi:hypothetical protein
VGLKVSIHIGSWKDKVWKWASPRNLPVGRSFGPHNQTLLNPTLAHLTGCPDPQVRTKLWGREGNFWAPGVTQGGTKKQGKIPQTEAGWDNLPKSEQANS